MELPGCIGWMDGTDIKLAEAPILDRDSYYDKDKVSASSFIKTTLNYTQTLNI
jgi:hypothetical protein